MAKRDNLIANIVDKPEDNRSVMERLADLPEEERLKALDMLIAKYCDGDPTKLKYKWELWRRGNQWFPEHDDWKHCAFLAGRGFGKTRVGAEIVRHVAENKIANRIGIIAPTAHDATAVCLFGESGLFNISPPDFRPTHHPTYKQVTWPNGVQAYLFALDIKTEVPTPEGFKSFQDIHVGDKVFDELGNECNVIYETPVMVGNKCYELTFKNGQKVVCDKDHLWRISTVSDRDAYMFRGKEYKFRTITTQEIFDNFVVERKNPNRNDDFNNWIRFTKPVNYNEKELEIPSYVLGAWLGDGCKNDGGFISADRQIVSEIESYGYEVSHNDKYPITWYIRGLKPQLRRLGVFKNKHIPDIYKLGSVEQRLSLLQGLMDTDGTITKTGEIVFSNTNENLIDGVCELVASLGGWASKHLCKPKKNNPYDSELPIWKVSIRKIDNIFRLQRKLGRMRNRKRSHEFPIVAIKEVESTPVKCIRVDSESHLFLITRSYLPTHNSAEDPESLRGHQFGFIWGDECAAWNRGLATWQQAIATLRLGKNPRSVITTTPKANELIKTIVGNPRTWTVTGSTYENANNIAIDEMAAMFEGTRLGKQELYGEILQDVEGALWKQSWIDKNRIELKDIEKLPEFLYIAMAIDPAMTTNKNSDETGFCVAAYGLDDKYYILYADSHKDTAMEWAKRAFKLYDDYGVVSIVAETNQGGDMVLQNLSKLRPEVMVNGIHAKKGKALRAEEVVHLYELGKVRHVGHLARAESQMTEFNPILNPNGKDDICLIGETLIDTSDGQKQLKDVKENDLALTRNGYKKILASKITGIDTLVYAMLVSDGNILVGTENHPVFIQNKDFVRIKDIEVGDLVFKCQKDEKLMWKSLNSMGLNIDDIQIQKTQASEDISTQAQTTLEKDLEDYIEKFGNLFTEKSQKDISYTTKTEIILTTTFQILSVFQKLSILRNTKKSYRNDPNNQISLNILKEFELWLQNGINLLKEESGIENMQKLVTLERLKTINVFVHSVVQNSILLETAFYSALESAQQNTTDVQVSMLLKSNVSFAELLLLIITHMEKDQKSIVQDSVLGKFPLRKETVYNLKVEEDSEYFANGILTHNCDALVYCVKHLIEKAMVSSVYYPAVGGLRHKLQNFRAR